MIDQELALHGVRSSVMEYQWRVYGREKMLPDICIDIMSTLSGSSCPMPRDELYATCLFLVARHRTWEKGFGGPFDLSDAVFDMLTRTMAAILPEFATRLEWANKGDAK